MPLLLLFLAAGVLLADDGAQAKYVGGTVAAIQTESDGRLFTTDETFFEFRSKGRQHHVPYGDVNLLEYGQNVSRRVALAAVVSPLFVLSKARKHFLTVGYTSRDGKQQAMVFRVDKDKIRAILVSLEARTGLKVTYQDNEARKAGKG